MSMDLFRPENDTTRSRAMRTTAPLLPVEAGEGFAAAWDNAVLFGQSVNWINARNRATESLTNDTYSQTRDDRFRYDSIFEEYARSHKQYTEVYNDRVAKYLAEQPEREASGVQSHDIKPMTDDDIGRRGEELSRNARNAYREMNQRNKTWGGTFGMLGGTAIGAVLDPVNLVTFPLAAPEAYGVIKTGLAWAGIGAGTQAGIEVLGAPYRERVEPGYLGSGEPVENVLESGVFAGGLGAGLRALGFGLPFVKDRGGRAWDRLKGNPDTPRTIRDAGNVLESEANIRDTNPFPRSVQSEAEHRAATAKTIDDVVAGDPPEVRGIVSPQTMADYEAQLIPILRSTQATVDALERARFLEREDARLPGTMERLSEQQLAEIRAAHVGLEEGLAARQADLTAQLEKARAAVEAQTARIETLRAEPTPANTRKLAQAEAKLPGLIETAQKREGALPLAQITAEARARRRQATARNELVKAIDRLASEGYGVKLGEGEAAAFAERILKAEPDAVEAVLRDTTEALVDKARGFRATQPVLPLGAPRPHEEAKAEAVRLLNLTRGRVQRLARERGYDMPKEEAGSIAARLVSLTEPERLPILDELMVRPRTLAASLTEPPPTVPANLPQPPTAEELAKQMKPVPAEPAPVAAEAARPAVVPQAYDAARVEQLTPENVAKLPDDPEFKQTVDREFQKMRADTPDKEIPGTGRTVDEVATDIEQRQRLAEEVRASCGPQPTDGDEGGGGGTAAALAGAGVGGAGLLTAGGGGEAQAAEQPQPSANLSGVEKSFLSALNLYEQAGLAGTDVKLYNDIVQRGRTEPITEKDLSQQDRQQLKDLVLSTAERTGKTKGHVDYKDYQAHTASRPFADQLKNPTLSANILGGFDYDIKDGEIKVTDTWDFNMKTAGRFDDNPIAQAFAGALAPRELFASIGRKVISDKSGKGIPVNIRLGHGGE
jgi:hypothetical protein